jgi:putative membrane protein
LGLPVLLAASLAACAGNDRTPPPQTASAQLTSSAVSPGPEPIAPPTPAETPPVEPTLPSTPSAGSPSMDVPGPGAPLTSGDLLIGNGNARSPEVSPDRVAPTTITSDAQIVGVLAAGNETESDQARVAVRKASDPHVRQFAGRVVTDLEHARGRLENLETRARITAEQGTVSSQVKQAAERTMTAMRASSASDFDRTYISAQVEAQHQRLEFIDRTLNEAKNGALTDLLREERPRVAARLREAKDVQAALNR